jgi:hypothetical protein
LGLAKTGAAFWVSVAPLLLIGAPALQGFGVVAAALPYAVTLLVGQRLARRLNWPGRRFLLLPLGVFITHWAFLMSIWHARHGTIS